VLGFATRLPNALAPLSPPPGTSAYRYCSSQKSPVHLVQPSVLTSFHSLPWAMIPTFQPSHTNPGMESRFALACHLLRACVFVGKMNCGAALSEQVTTLMRNFVTVALGQSPTHFAALGRGLSLIIQPCDSATSAKCTYTLR
jgi:hypothetical protein